MTTLSPRTFIRRSQFSKAVSLIPDGMTGKLFELERAFQCPIGMEPQQQFAEEWEKLAVGSNCGVAEVHHLLRVDRPVQMQFGETKICPSQKGIGKGRGRKVKEKENALPLSSPRASLPQKG